MKFAVELLERFQPSRLTAQVASTREPLSLPSPEMADLVRADPLGLRLRDRPGRRGVGDEAGRLVRRLRLDRRPQPLAARPAAAAATDTVFGRALRAAETIERDLARAHAASGGDTPPPRIRFAAATRSLPRDGSWPIRAESIWNTVGSLAVILPLLYIAFRSPWLVAVGAVPSSWHGAGRWPRTRNGIPLSAAAATPRMQFGLGIDGVVLLYVAYRHGGGSSPTTAMRILRPMLSMLLGMWTTAATFYGLTVVDFPSLQELGPLIGHSMMICGVLTLVLVPALLPATPPSVSDADAGWLPRLVARRRGHPGKRSPSRRRSPRAVAALRRSDARSAARDVAGGGRGRT